MTAKPATRTLCDQLAAFLKQRPNTWIDGREIARIAGAYAWRSRISNLRRPPYGMAIENRQYIEKLADGRKVRVSLYQYVPAETQTTATEAA